LPDDVNVPSSLVTVCVVLSLFVQVTLVPAFTERESGLKANPAIVTEFGGGGGPPELVGLLLLEHEESNPAATSARAIAATNENLCLFIGTPYKGCFDIVCFLERPEKRLVPSMFQEVDLFPWESGIRTPVSGRNPISEGFS
jgi:hypothetical protein